MQVVSTMIRPQNKVASSLIFTESIQLDEANRLEATWWQNCIEPIKFKTYIKSFSLCRIVRVPVQRDRWCTERTVMNFTILINLNILISGWIQDDFVTNITRLSVTSVIVRHSYRSGVEESGQETRKEFKNKIKDTYENYYKWFQIRNIYIIDKIYMFITYLCGDYIYMYTTHVLILVILNVL